MHNGMFYTLREVIDYCNDPERRVSGNVHRDAKLDRPLGLTVSDIADLQASMESLSDERFR
jgi:cytochrome c peroxidase